MTHADLSYQQALDWIMSFWAPSRTREEERAQRPLKVQRMRLLLERLGFPHLRYPSVLVAGTKGKGSTAAFIAEGLRAAGYRVGRYTQPHLIDWRERSWVDGRIIEPDEVAHLVEEIRPAVDSLADTAPGLAESGSGLGTLTTYEIGTALTLLHFARSQVEVAVLEIGVGGRMDALNAVDPVLSVIASISLDHTDVLGNSLGEIAEEKSGIMRAGRAVVVAPQQPEAEEVIRRTADVTGSRLFLVGQDWRWAPGAKPGTVDITGPDLRLEGARIALLGDHQRDNATLAVAALRLLVGSGFSVGPEAIRRALAGVEWPGRIQILGSVPIVVADAAHNGDSAMRLAETLRKEFTFDRMVLVFGASAAKDISGMARWLGPEADLVLITSSGHRRAADHGPLVEEFSRYAPTEAVPDPAEAFARARELAGRNGLVVITGSVFLVGRALELLPNRTTPNG